MIYTLFFSFADDDNDDKFGSVVRFFKKATAREEMNENNADNVRLMALIMMIFAVFQGLLWWWLHILHFL